MTRFSPTRMLRAARRRFLPGAVRHGDAVLPPPEMRYCGSAFKDDATFLASGRAEARRLVKAFDLSRESRMLEIGCGPGRLPIGILAELGEIERYDGVDLDEDALRWCRRYLTKPHPTFGFHAVDARHERYNPTGPEMKDGFTLPFDQGCYDLVYLHSVFANMVEDDIRVYCTEFHRVLVDSGRVFLTAFVEEGVPPSTVNPSDYHIASEGPLNLIRFEKEFFLSMLRDAGFHIERFEHGVELGGQSAVYLDKV